MINDDYLDDEQVAQEGYYWRDELLPDDDREEGYYVEDVDWGDDQ